MGALPRPATPGPWEVEKPRPALVPARVVIRSGTGPDVTIEVAHTNTGDAAAIAATPERIAREDRVREVCARVGKGEVFLYEDAFPRPWNMPKPTQAVLARYIEAILDGADTQGILDGEEGA